MRSVALHTGPDTYLDHLGVIASLLEIPLIVTEEKTFEACKKFYPSVSCSRMDFAELTLDFLAAQFETIYMSSHQWTAELLPLIELFYRKKMRMVYCPHGNSDKGHSHTHHFRKDIALVYGSHMHDLLEKTGALSKIEKTVLTGNFRLSFYRKHQPFYDALLKERWSYKRQTLLYAPTWADGESDTSFFSYCEKLLEELSPHFDLIVKLHPFLEDRNPSETWKIVEKFSPKPGIVFLSDFPPIYPILNGCDGYVGDSSSIGYDFLAFNKPMFFLTDVQGPIKNCGQKIPDKTNAARFIQASWNDGLEEKRREVYRYAFGKENKELKKKIEEALSEDRASWL